MAFEWDNLHERTWLRWCQPGGLRIETKRRVAGSALHVDVVVWGAVGRVQPALDFVPEGLVAIENKSPSKAPGLADVVGFHGRIGLLLEREAEETGTLPDLDRVTGVLFCSRLAPRLASHPGLSGTLVAPGIRRIDVLRPFLYLVVAEELEPTSHNTPLVLYYGDDRAARRLVREASVEALLAHLPGVLPVRRAALDPLLRERGIHMSSPGELVTIHDIETRIGWANLIDMFGLKRVVEEYGEEPVMDGLKAELERAGRMQRQGGLNLKTAVAESGGLRAVIEAYGREHVLQLLREMEDQEQPPEHGPG